VQLFTPFRPGFQGSLRQDQSELFAAIPASHVLSARLVEQHPAQGAQQPIPARMAEGVVKPFKMIQIHHDDPQAGLLALYPVQFPLQGLQHEAAVE
jgi:hypothetical protein